MGEMEILVSETKWINTVAGGREFIKDIHLKGNEKDDTLRLKGLFEDGYVLLATDQSELGNLGWEYFLNKCLMDSATLGITDRIVRIEPLHWIMVRNDIHLKKRMKKKGFDKLSPKTSQIAFTGAEGEAKIGIAKESDENFLSAARALMKRIKIAKEPSANKECE